MWQNDRKMTDRREFLQLVGLGSAAAVLNSSIAKALTIPANFKTGTINDVEHIVILMQEKQFVRRSVRHAARRARLFRPARGQAEERQLHIPAACRADIRCTATGFVENGVTYGWSAKAYGGLTTDLVVPTVPDQCVGRDHNQCALCHDSDQQPRPGVSPGSGPWLAARHRSPQRRRVGRVDPFQEPSDHGLSRAGGRSVPPRTRRCVHGRRQLLLLVPRSDECEPLLLVDGLHRQYSGQHRARRHSDRPGHQRPWRRHRAQQRLCERLSAVLADLSEMLQAAGISWRIYQDIVGDTVATPTAITNDQGSGPIPTNSAGQAVCNGNFVGNYTDNPVLYFQQYASAPSSSPLFQKGATGTGLAYNTPRAHRLAGCVGDMGRGPLRPVPERRAKRHAAAGVLAGRPRRLYRASGVAQQLRRLVHLPGAGYSDRQSDGVQQDRIHRQL